MTNSTVKSVALVLTALLVFLTVLQIRACIRPRHSVTEPAIIRTDTVWVARPLDVARDLPSRPATPARVTVFQPPAERDTIRVYVPVTLTDKERRPAFQALRPDGVRVTSRRVDLHVYDFDLGTDVRMTYRVPPKAFQLGLWVEGIYAGGDHILVAPMLEAQFHERYRVGVGVGLDPVNERVVPMVTVRARIF